MTITYTASVNCDAQRSVKCYGALFVQDVDPQALPRLAVARLEAKGWRRIPKYLERPRDVCPACLAGLAEHQAGEKVPA